LYYYIIYLRLISSLLLPTLQ